MSARSFRAARARAVPALPAANQKVPGAFCKAGSFQTSTLLKATAITLRLSLVLGSLAALPLYACGIYFPNYLLVGGDQAVLGGAELCFTRELERMKLVHTRHKAAPARVPFVEESRDAELSDLQLALNKAGVGAEAAARILSAHTRARNQLTQFASEVKKVEESRLWTHDGAVVARGEPTLPWPKLPLIEITPGLPAEFADYFEGAIAWHNPFLVRKAPARQCWERLLERPDQERKFKSVWAAYMLGRSWLEEDPEKARGYLRQTRALASRGFADPIGLATASLGLEARLELLRTNYVPAIELYLEQLAAGDPSAALSLRFVAAEALRSDTDTLRRLAATTRSQRVITAYLLSVSTRRYTLLLADPNEETPSKEDLARRWLEAIEAAAVSDADSAEKLALVAYQANHMDLAERWIKVAPKEPLAQWLQAKLLLRAGKVTEAAAMLAKVTHAFPVLPRGTNVLEPRTLQDTLVAGTCEGNLIPIERQVLGELGVLRLARREFTQALDSLLNAGFWMDAAYVAERVLTLEELKGYVDSSWPPVSAAQQVQEKEEFGDDAVSPALLRERIRYLLARRLSRASRSDEARAYYPEEWLPQIDTLCSLLKAGWDLSLPAGERASAFFQAAIIARTNGMELIGTEVEPDWHIHNGKFAEGVSLADRSETQTNLLAATREELRRGSVHVTEPDQRFHYRYQAASLAWEAAQLLPDNSDLTAYVLWRAGSWLKYQDPPMADIFYKALVRRNRKTVLGAEADRRRWFPLLDEQGNILAAPAKPTPPDNAAPEGESGPAPLEPLIWPENSPEPQETGLNNSPENGIPEELTSQSLSYVVHRGDSMGSIIHGLKQAGLSVSVQDLKRLNPGLQDAKLKVGQVINIPSHKGEPE